MRPKQNHFTRLCYLGFIVFGFATSATGCAASRVGDPCIPEQVPPGGFVSSETYLETSSVQCQTRVCLVYRYDGDPTKDCVVSAASPNLPPECENRVYCTCRCGAPEGVKATLCDCPSGFSCEPLLESAEAPAGIRGSYCVRTSTVEPQS
jgi:hypothetical protein